MTTEAPSAPARGIDPLSAAALAVVATLATIYIVSQFIRNSIGVIAPNLVSELGLSPIEIGMLSSIYFFVFAATQLPLGVVLDRFGPRPCILICIVLTAAGCWAFGLAQSAGQLVLSRALLGFATSSFLMAPVALYARWFAPSRFSTISGIHLGIGSFGALFATYATLASLVGAARHGEGRIADVSLVEASIAAAAWEAAEYLETGNVPQPMGNRHRLTAPYQLFETKDKRYVAIGTPNDMLFGKLMQTLKLEHLITDPRFTTYAKRKANEDDLVPYVEPAVREWIAADIEAELMKQGVPCACVNNFKEVFEHPQIVARNVVQEVEHPRLGRMKVTRNPILMDHDGPDLSRPSPMLGEHSEEILRDLGYSADDIQKLAASGVTKLAAPVRKMTAAE